jgi:hypothetical protein
MATDLVGVVPVLRWLRRIRLGQVLQPGGLIGFHLHHQVVAGGNDGFNRFFSSTVNLA